MTEKYDSIGIDYNLTRQADPYLVERLYYHLNPKQNGIYLDIGCGTGNYTNALHKKGIQIIGVDPSMKMLDKAKAKNTSIEWKQGKSETIPLQNKSIEGCIATLTLHHWPSINSGFKDVFRVLKSNGRFVIFTSTPKQMKGYWLNHYFPNMLDDSIQQMSTLETMEQALTQNNFKIVEIETYSVKSDLQDLFLYAGKHNPKLYLDEQVRHGISSFSALANKKEIKQGLALLEREIKNGSIIKRIENYKNNDGDYMFVVAEK